MSDIDVFLKAGQAVISKSETAATGIGKGKMTGGTYGCDYECEGGHERVSVYWPDGTIKYPCSREMVYISETDSWEMKSEIPYCEHDIAQ